MNACEYQEAKIYLRTEPIIDSRRDLEKYLEAVITIRGHAWCMDVKDERHKLAKLIVTSLHKQK